MVEVVVFGSVVIGGVVVEACGSSFSRRIK